MMINFAGRGAIFLGLLAIAVALPVTNVDTKKCLQRNGLFSKQGSFCKSYYRCKNWVPFEEECPPGQNFNPSKGWCDWYELFPCFEKKSEICLEPDGKYLKPATDCKIFYDCCNGVATEKTCPEDSLFDPSAKKCEWPELYTCVEGIRTTKFTTDSSPTVISTIITTVTSDETLISGDPFKTSTYHTSSIDYSSSSSDSTETIISSTNDELNTETELRSKLTSDLTTNEYITFTDRFTKGEVTSPSDTYTDSNDRTIPSLSTKETISVTPHKHTTIDVFFSASETTVKTNLSEETTPYVYYKTSPSVNEGKGSTSEESITWSTTAEIPDKQKTTAVSFSKSTNADKTDQWEETTSTVYYKTSPSVTERKSSGTEKQITWSTTAGIPEKEFSTRVPDEWPDTLVTDKFTPREKKFSTPSIGDVTISTTLNIMCPKPWGYFPHPTDKHKFIGCVNGEPSILSCPSDLVYNPKKKACDYS